MNTIGGLVYPDPAVTCVKVPSAPPTIATHVEFPVPAVIVVEDWT
jgi:hypothetical protein